MPILYERYFILHKQLWRQSRDNRSLATDFHDKPKSGTNVQFDFTIGVVNRKHCIARTASRRSNNVGNIKRWRRLHVTRCLTSALHAEITARLRDDTTTAAQWFRPHLRFYSNMTTTDPTHRDIVQCFIARLYFMASNCPPPICIYRLIPLCLIQRDRLRAN